MKKLLLLVLTCFISLSLYTSTGAEDLRVGTIERPPLAYEDDNKWSGFSIDIWQAIAKKTGYTTDYKKYINFSEMIDDTRDGDVDLSVANISITLEREEEMDFSYPIYDSGLTMMIKSSGEKPHILMQTLRNPIIMTLLILTIAGILAYIYRKQICKVCKIKKEKKKFYKYLIASLTSLWFLGFIIYFNYTLITNKFEQQSLGGLFSYEDITGEIVGVTSGSTSEKFVNNKSISYIGYQTINEVYNALEVGKIDIMIHDLPVLEYYAKNMGKGKVEIIGDVFHKEKYGILMPNNSPLKEDINRALLEIRGNGEYEEIFEKYFSL